MRKLRILHIVPDLAVGGGVQSIILNWYRNIDRSKVQFDFITIGENNGLTYIDEIIYLGGKVYYSNFDRIINYKKFSKDLSSVIGNNSNYSGIHCHISFKNFVALYVAKKNKIPIRISHSHEAAINLQNNIFSKIKKSILKLVIYIVSSHQVGCSNIANKYLHLNCKKNIILLNALDYSVYNSSNVYFDEIHLLRKKVLLAQVGRLEEVKNHEFTLYVLKELIERKIDAHLIINGEGKRKEYIVKRSKVIGCYNNITFIPFIKEVNKIYNSVDIVLIPSFHEAFSMVAIEAQASNRLCFASNNVPIETDFNLGLIQYLSLEKGPAYWAEKIIESLTEKIKINKINYNSKFEVKNIVEKLTHIYNLEDNAHEE